MSLLRGCIAKLAEINEWFRDREKVWAVVTDRWDGGVGSSLRGRCVPDFGYVYGEGAVITVVGIRGCDGSVCGLGVCRGREA